MAEPIPTTYVSPLKELQSSVYVLSAIGLALYLITKKR